MTLAETNSKGAQEPSRKCGLQHFAAGPGRGYGKLNFLLRNSVRPGSQISQISSKRARSGREVFSCGKDRYWRLRGCRMRAWNPYWMSAHLRIVGPRTEGSDMKK